MRLDLKLIAFDMKELSEVDLPTIETALRDVHKLRLLGLPIAIPILEKMIEDNEAILEIFRLRKNAYEGVKQSFLGILWEKAESIASTDDHFKRVCLTEALGTFGDESNLETLRALLGDSRSESMRIAIAEAMGKIGEQEDYAQLDIFQRTESNKEIREAMHMAQIEILIRQDNMEAIVKFRTPFSNVRQKMVDILLAEETDRQVFRGYLRSLIPPTQYMGLLDELKIASAQKLVDLGRRDDLEACWNLLGIGEETRQSFNNDVRKAVGETVVSIEFREGGTDLLRSYARGNSTKEIELAAIKKLAQEGRLEDIDILKRRLSDKNEDIAEAARESAVAIIIRAGNTNAVRELFESRDRNRFFRFISELSYWLADASADIESPRGRNQRKRHSRIALCEAIGEVGKRRDIKKLRGLLKDSEAEVRAAAARALGKIGSQQDVKYLRECSAGKAAAEAIVEIWVRERDYISLREGVGREPMSRAAIYGLVKLSAREGWLSNYIDVLMENPWGIRALTEYFAKEEQNV